MLRQKQEKSGTGICHVMQGKESKTCPCDFPHNKPMSLNVINNGKRDVRRVKKQYGQVCC